MISEHISEGEYRCKHCGKLPPAFYAPGTMEISAEYLAMFACYEGLRAAYGAPIPVSRGYSCPAHNTELYLRSVVNLHGLSLADVLAIARDTRITPFGVHPFGLALDLVPPKEDIPKVVKLARLNNFKPRIGWQLYQKNAVPHVHIDLGFLVVPIWNVSLRPGEEW